MKPSLLAPWVVIGIVLLFVALVMAPNLISELPDRDAGVFLYVGSRILDGETPYRDIWDHKGPLIYYINAIGIALTPGSERGVWALEVIALSLSGFGLYRLLRKGFGPLPAVLGVGLFYVGLGYVLHPGNYTEEFSLPLPISAVLAARFFQHLMGPSDESELRLGAAISPRVGWAVGLALVILILPLRRLLPPFLTFLDNGSRDAFERAADLTQYDEEYLLMWGAESTFNFLSDKPAPTRYVYQYPLYTCGYVSPSMVEEFRADVVSRLPLIVDSSSSNPAVPPIDAQARSAWSEESDSCSLTTSMVTLLLFIDEHYEPVGRMAYTGWPIYRVQD